MLCITLAGWCASPAAFALDTGDIVVTSIKGDVHVTVNGAARAMKAGGVLETPASIRTGHDGSVELKQGATTVSVGPDTQLEFPALEKRGGAIDRIVQPRGNAFYSIGKREGGHKLRVETPYLVGVIKGTQFNVATQEESTTISLFEGRLEVHATDESDVVDLNAGEIATRKRGDKTITVMKMDGKIPTTPPKPTSGNGGGNPADGSRPRDAGDSLVTGGVQVNPRGETGVSVGANADSVGGGVDVRAGANEVDADVGVAVGETGAKINASVNLNDGAAVTTGVNVASPVASVDAGVNVGVGSTGVDANVNAGVSVAPLGADVSTNTSVDLNAGGANVASNTSVAAGPVTADLGVAAGVSTGPTNLGADLGASSTVAGPVAANLGTTTAVDAGTSGVAAAVNAGTSAAIGNTSIVDTSTSVAANLGTTPAVNVGTTTAVAGVETGVAAAVNASTGTVDLGLNVAGTNVNVGVDLGTGSNGTTTTTTTTPPVTTPTTDVVDLLSGLVRRKK